MKLPVEIDSLQTLARDAGALAVQHFGAVTPEQKADGSLVTEADRAVQRLVLSRLRELVPDVTELFVQAEENTEDANRGVQDWSQSRFVAAVDPIDGTTSFATGLPLWSVSIGLLSEGHPVAGVVHLPLLGAAGWTYAVDAGGPARLNGAPFSVRPHRPGDTLTQLAVPSGFLRWGRLPGFAGKLRSLGSTAHHLCLTASGVVDAAVLGRPHVWDIAAAAALLERAGGVLRTADGKAVDWEALLADERGDSPLLAGAPQTVSDLADQLQIRSRPSTAAG